MSLSTSEDHVIENYFTQTLFKQLVMYPILASDLIPAVFRKGLKISASSSNTLNNTQLAKCSDMYDLQMFDSNLTNLKRADDSASLSFQGLQVLSTSNEPSATMADLNIRNPHIFTNIKLYEFYDDILYRLAQPIYYS